MYTIPQHYLILKCLTHKTNHRHNAQAQPKSYLCTNLRCVALLVIVKIMVAVNHCYLRSPGYNVEKFAPDWRMCVCVCVCVCVFVPPLYATRLLSRLLPPPRGSVPAPAPPPQWVSHCGPHDPSHLTCLPNTRSQSGQGTDP